MIPSLAPLTTRLRRRLAATLAVAVAAFLPLAAPNGLTAQAAERSASAAAAPGYWMVASDGGIFSFGSAKFFGSTGNIKLNQPIVGIAATPSGNGYWMVATDGGIFAYGDAKFFGSTGSVKLNKPIVGMASTPSGNGYWLVASDGGIFAYGDAKFFGSTGSVKLNKPIVGMASTPSGNGYWFVASDGGIFAFGDAKFFGSTGDIKLAKPITSMASTPSGKGYWFTASDGGIFSYGDAKFFGAATQVPAAGERIVAAMVPSPDGDGYWQASATGELLAFGSAPDFGGLPTRPNRPIVGMTAARAGATGVQTTGPTGPGTTGPTTVTTMPPYTGPMSFSSTALNSWGTPNDPNKTFTNTNGEVKTPYSQKVLAITEVGSRILVGGEFTNMVDLQRNPSPSPMAYLAELDTNGIPVPGSAINANLHLDGPVMALLRSSDGSRVYVAGGFGHVNGNSNRARLFAINTATGNVDATFNPPTPNAYVNSLALLGNTLYVGGRFSTLGSDATRPQLAGLNATTGEIIPGFTPPPRYIGKYMTHTGVAVHDPQGTDPNVPDNSNLTNPSVPDPGGIVDALTVTGDGKYLMVGGDFLHFGTPYDPNLSLGDNNKHGGLIAVDPVTGQLCGQPGVACTWQPENSRPIYGLTVWPGDGGKTVFAAAGGAGGRVIAFQSGGKTTALWKGNVDGDGMAVVATNDWVFLVGHFDWEVHNPAAKCLNQPTPSGGYNCTPDPNAPPPPDQTPTPHRHLVAFDARGDRQPTNPSKFTGNSVVDPYFTAQADTSEGPFTAFIGANRLYVGGNFSKVSASPTANGRDQQYNQPGLAIYPAR